MEKKLFGTTASGTEVYTYTLTNAQGMQITVTELGATLMSVLVQDKNGSWKDVVLGYDKLENYELNPNYFGATIGRNGNRIANASFVLNGVKYELVANDNTNNHHSGPNGFEKRIWDMTDASDDHVTFSYVSPDGDEGFPGEFKVSVTYTLTDDNEIKIHYEGVSDQDTVANLTDHSYFNLSGHDAGLILDHTVMIDADGYTAVNEVLVPYGEIIPVEGTPMDFRTEKTIGLDLEADYEQLKLTTGYDHNYVLNGQGEGVRLIARAKSPVTGIGLEVYTDTPGVHFYIGNFIGGPAGKNGAAYDVRHGFCLETQYYPNSVNIPEFPSPILKKGEKYDSTTIYKFI